MLTCAPKTHIKVFNIKIFILKIMHQLLKVKILNFQYKTSIFGNLNTYI